MTINILSRFEGTEPRYLWLERQGFASEEDALYLHDKCSAFSSLF